jgi:RNA 2',3'-cyclic 3'-phosphodiesterase
MFRADEQRTFPWHPAGPLATDRLIFMALPSDSTAQLLSRVAYELKRKYELSARPFAANRFHISLLHIEDYCGFPHDAVERLKEAASKIVFPPIEIVLNRAMSFSGAQGQPPRANDYALALLAEQTTELTALREALISAMAKAGIKPRGRSHLKPHLTLLYDQDHRIDEAIEPIRRTIHELVLIHSLLGKTQYRELGRWPLLGRRPVRSAGPPDKTQSVIAS